MDPRTHLALGLARETSEFSLHAFERRPIPTDLESVSHAAHCLRMQRFVAAICDLVWMGHMEPAGALSRTVLEAGWVVLAIQKDPAKFGAWLSHANSESRKSIKRLKELKLDERGAGMTDADIDAAIATIPEGASHSVKAWAAAAGTPQAYVTLYQTLSGYSHAEMMSAASYIEWSPEGHPLAVRVPDIELSIADALNMCTALLHDVCRTFITEGTDDFAALAALEARREVQTHQLDQWHSDEDGAA